MGPQNKCPPLAPHAHGGLQFYLQLLHLYACQCKPNFDSKAPERLQVHCGPVQGNPHPPNENAPLPHPKKFAFLQKTTSKKATCMASCLGYVGAMIQPTVYHISTRKPGVNHTLGTRSLKRNVWMQPSSVPTASHKGCLPEISTEENLAQVNFALLPERVLTGCWENGVFFNQEIMLWYQCCSNNTNWNFD